MTDGPIDNDPTGDVPDEPVEGNDGAGSFLPAAKPASRRASRSASE